MYLCMSSQIKSHSSDYVHVQCICAYMYMTYTCTCIYSLPNFMCDLLRDVRMRWSEHSVFGGPSLVGDVPLLFFLVSWTS